jgi:hypothetical protein
VALWWRRRRPATPAAVDLLDPELPELPDHVEPATVRALRAQVRTLEEALENAGDGQPVPVVTREPVPVVTAEADILASYRRQVRLAVLAVSLGASPDDDPQHAVARVAAAIDRLDRPGTLARPALPETFGRVASAPEVRAVQVVRVPAAPVVVTPEPDLEDELDVMAHMTSLSAPAPPWSDTDTDTEAEAGAGAEVVLPVPPPAPAEPRRGRRRQRHSAA